MSERISLKEVTFAVKRDFADISPLVAVLAWDAKDTILLGRGNQRWIMTIREIPSE